MENLTGKYLDAISWINIDSLVRLEGVLLMTLYLIIAVAAWYATPLTMYKHVANIFQVLSRHKRRDTQMLMTRFVSKTSPAFYSLLLRGLLDVDTA